MHIFFKVSMFFLHDKKKRKLAHVWVRQKSLCACVFCFLCFGPAVLVTVFVRRFLNCLISKCQTFKWGWAIQIYFFICAPSDAGGAASARTPQLLLPGQMCRWIINHKHKEIQPASKRERRVGGGGRGEKASGNVSVLHIHGWRS